MKKLSDEIVVGIIAIVTLIAFVWLYSFLKGHGIFSNIDKYHIVYANAGGLEESSPVELNGYKVGIVQDVKLLNNGSGMIQVDISIDKGILIPKESIAEITTASLIAGMKIRIRVSDETSFYENGDTIPGRLAVSVLDKMEANFDPIVRKADTLIDGLNNIIGSMNDLFNNELKNDLSESVSNLNRTSSELKQILSGKKQDIESLIQNLSDFSEMVSRNSGKMDTAFSNLASVSDSLAASNISTAFNNLEKSLGETSTLLEGLNDGNGTAGKILHDDSLYFNLSNSLGSLEFLLRDLRENPGRYVQFSIFGGKNK